MPIFQESYHLEQEPNVVGFSLDVLDFLEDGLADFLPIDLLGLQQLLAFTTNLLDRVVIVLPKNLLLGEGVWAKAERKQEGDSDGLSLHYHTMALNLANFHHTESGYFLRFFRYLWVILFVFAGI